MNAEALKQDFHKVSHDIKELQEKLKASKNLTYNIDRLQRSSAYMTSKMVNQKEEMVCLMKEKIKQMKKKVKEDEEKISNARETARKVAQIRLVCRILYH